VKAISLVQPWASLLVHGVKTIETRAWRPGPHFRPPCWLAVHASKYVSPGWRAAADRMYLAAPALRDELSKSGVDPDDPPTGAVLGFIRVSALYRAEQLTHPAATAALCPFCDADALTAALSGRLQVVNHIPLLDRYCGDYACGRWAWVTDARRALPEPLPCKGGRGLWNFPTALAPAGVGV
jgi:hypothetical protein